MPSFLDTQETSQHFGKQIAEFCSLLDTNHLHHGSPEDFFEFARVLERSNQFRYDLSALVKSVMRKEHDELLLTDMMSIIAASVGGPSSAETRADITGPTNTLMEFLLGTGCWRQFGSPLPASPGATGAMPPPGKSVRSEEPGTLRASHSASSIPLASESIPLPREIPESPENPESPEDRAGIADAPGDLRQTLTRLEINSLQVKHHLDAIEQRLSRIEPMETPPDVPAAPASEPREPLPRPVIAHSVPAAIARSAAEIPAWEPELPTRGRAVFSHPPEPLESEEDGLSSPTFGYAGEEDRNRVPVRLFLTLLAIMAIVAAFFFFVPPAQRQAMLDSGLSRLHSVRASFGIAPPPVPAAPSAPLPSTPAPASATPEQAPQTPPAPAKDVAASTPAPSAASDAPAPVPPDVRPSPATRYIQSNVMEGKLLSAPRPEYPPRAREAHIEGTVALQAVISKAGSVETLHVIKGPSALRGAAIDAVRDWRYQPYIIDGRQAEIATTIYVDFTLKPPPAIAR